MFLKRTQVTRIKLECVGKIKMCHTICIPSHCFTEATLAPRTLEKVFPSPDNTKISSEHSQPTFSSHPSPHNGMALYNSSRSPMLYLRSHLHPEPERPCRLPESYQRYPDGPEATPATRIVGHSSWNATEETKTKGENTHITMTKSELST